MAPAGVLQSPYSTFNTSKLTMDHPNQVSIIQEALALVSLKIPPQIR